MDNKKLGEIGNGDTKEFIIEKGEHILYAKIDWFLSKKIKIQLNEDEIKVVNLKSSNFSQLKFPAILLITILGYYLSGIYLAVFITIFFLFIIYTMTLGKNAFLILEA